MKHLQARLTNFVIQVNYYDGVIFTGKTFFIEFESPEKARLFYT